MKSTNDILYEGYLARKVEEAGKIKYYMVKSIVDVLDWYFKNHPNQVNPREVQSAKELIDAYLGNTCDVLMKSYNYTPDSFNDTWNKKERFDETVKDFAVSVLLHYVTHHYNIPSTPQVANIANILLRRDIEPVAAFNEWKAADREMQKGIKAAGANLDF